MTSRTDQPPALHIGPSFVGERLRQAREAYGLTLETLGGKIGRSKQQLSRYESGHDAPVHEVLLLLTEHLQQPLSYFFYPVATGSSEAVTFYRKLKRVKPPELRRAQAWRSWLEEIVQFAADYLELPPFDVPEDLFVPFAADDVDPVVIDDLAFKLRQHWELGQRPVGNVVRTLERRGVLVASFDVAVDDIDGYSLLSSRDETVPLIALNSFKANYFRSRFDAAHELGHLLLHRNVQASEFVIPQIYDRLERQAHRFASAFLLPDDAFLDDVSTYSLDAMVPLKEKWGVSLAAMLYRLQDLNVITTGEHTRLRANLARRKWNRIEPLDLTTTPERPVLLPQSIEALVGSAGFSKQDVLTDLRLSGAVVERLTSLPQGYFETPEQLPPLVAKTNLRLEN